MRTQLEKLVYEDGDQDGWDDDDETFDGLVIIPENPLEYRVCFALLASNLGYDPFDMITFTPDDTGRWRPKYADPGAFQGAFIIVDDPKEFHDEDMRTVEVLYEYHKDGHRFVSYRPVNEESFGLGVAQADFYMKYVCDDPMSLVENPFEFLADDDEELETS